MARADPIMNASETVAPVRDVDYARSSPAGTTAAARIHLTMRSRFATTTHGTV